MTVKVTRHFATVRGRWGVRQVHYRRAGSGPLCVMLHQSPQSSRELVPLLAAWGDDYTVIAPDSPGYGQSDPLGVAEATLDDFAEATIELLDALGVGRFGVYGFHTGGMIGIALADRYPERVTAVACNGVAVLSEAERADILADYLPAFEPSWDGSHLAWLWARLREQATFFPWHRRALASRMDFPMPAPDRLQASVLEFLRAAAHYHVAYRAAFVFRAEQVVPRLTVPSLLTAAQWDPLSAHLERLGDAHPDGVTVAVSESPAGALAACRAQLDSFPGDPPPGAPAQRPPGGRPWRDVLGTAVGSIQVRRHGPVDGPPVLVLHDAGGSAARVEMLAAALAGEVPVLCPDLPGHGESDAAPDTPGGAMGGAVAAVLAVLDALGLEHAPVIGVGAGAILALELATRAPQRVPRVALVDLPAYDAELRQAFRERGLPSLAAEWHGGHLLKAWHLVRDGRLYFPWFRRDQAGIRWQEPALDERALQGEVTDLLTADGHWQALLREVLDYDLAAALVRLRPQIAGIHVQPAGPYAALTQRAAQAAGLGCAGWPDDAGARRALVARLRGDPERAA